MSIHHPDHDSYRNFTKRQRVDKAVHTFRGILEGVSIDQQLNAAEVSEIINWSNEYRDLVGKAPFDEIIPMLDRFMEDGIIDPDEQADLLWVCTNLSPDSGYYSGITQDIQRLQGILHGVLADGTVTTNEAKGLQGWIDEHAHLKGTFPYDEIDALLMVALADGEIDSEEANSLKDYFEDFIDYSLSKKISQRSDQVAKKMLSGVCASCPEIVFDQKVFTFTGSSLRGKRSELADHVVKAGGVFSKNVTSKTQFLVVGSGGNPCWAFSCYGRKVEQAVALRKSGSPIIVLHESDFWDAIEDLS